MRLCELITSKWRKCLVYAHRKLAKLKDTFSSKAMFRDKDATLITLWVLFRAKYRYQLVPRSRHVLSEIISRKIDFCLSKVGRKTIVQQPTYEVESQVNSNKRCWPNGWHCHYFVLLVWRVQTFSHTRAARLWICTELDFKHQNLFNQATGAFLFFLRKYILQWRSIIQLHLALQRRKKCLGHHTNHTHWLWNCYAYT